MFRTLMVIIEFRKTESSRCFSKGFENDTLLPLFILKNWKIQWHYMEAEKSPFTTLKCEPFDSR